LINASGIDGRGVAANTADRNSTALARIRSTCPAVRIASTGLIGR
jgi:hypothetical protein